jgi:hypothetical protein
MTSFDHYENHAFSTAYFIDTADDTEQKRIVQHGFTEEVNELLTDQSGTSTLQLLKGMLEDVEETSALQAEKLSEVGDILYFMTAAGFYTPYSLRDIAQRGLQLFKAERADIDTFDEFDEQLHGLMATPKETYNPDYFGMQFFNFPPFIDSKGYVNTDIYTSEGKVLLHEDGLYAIERLTRDYETNMFDYLLPNGHIDSAGLLLCGLSLVAQHRLGGSLAIAAQLNVDKRNRRRANLTIVGGDDSERSRPAGAARPTLQGFENTEYNLLYGMRA